MNLAISETYVRTVTVSPLERLDAFTVPRLRHQLDELFLGGVTHFVIDLSRTPFLDSAGLAVLVSLLKRCRQAGGDVKLVWPESEPVRRILRLTRFDRVFEIIEDPIDLFPLGVDRTTTVEHQAIQ